jgi:hypothetical protein
MMLGSGLRALGEGGGSGRGCRRSRRWSRYSWKRCTAEKDEVSIVCVEELVCQVASHCFCALCSLSFAVALHCAHGSQE